jgi:N-alpha-acetyltransferase 15/16, NatA auxiliary subunit
MRTSSTKKVSRRHVCSWNLPADVHAGLKAVEAILKKNPNHGDTQAMKALIFNSQGHTDDAFGLAKVALTNDMKSHVCWHVYGLLYRSVKNFEESIKAYKFALKLEPDSQQIQRDLALLQIQMRDYPGYVQSRRAMLQSRPALRQNWTALAIAQHLDGDLEAAERTLTMYEESLRTPPSKTDLEHQECQLYKNNLIAEMGQTQRALEHLNAISKGNYDRQSIIEARAKHLMELGRKDEAATIYRSLLDRNLENRAHYADLEKALGIEESDIPKRKELYQGLAEKSSRADAPRRLPLDFLQGDEFRDAAEAYLQRMLSKGVPSTFANLKTLYADPAKQRTIQELVEDFAAGKQRVVNGDNDASKQQSQQSQFELYTLYFLAQHYDYYKSRDLSRAMTIIDQAIEKKPDTVDFHMTRARIFKHTGDLAGSALVMEYARTLDERDRYINTKAAKYQLRHNENAAALANMGKFTRQDAVGGPLGDLIDMQCMWFLWEDGDSWLRQNKLGLALKRFTSIYNIFEVWQEDQFDFHSFSMRRGQVRAYVELLRFEDRLREHPFWTRAAVAAVQAYILLYDFPHLTSGSGEAHAANGVAEDPAAAKKAAKKARKEKERQEQAEAERRDAKKTAGGKALSEDEKKKEDKDPEGKELLATTKPLEDAMKFLTPALEMSPRSLAAQKAGFELYLRRGKQGFFNAA